MTNNPAKIYFSNSEKPARFPDSRETYFVPEGSPRAQYFFYEVVTRRFFFGLVQLSEQNRYL